MRGLAVSVLVLALLAPVSILVLALLAPMANAQIRIETTSAMPPGGITRLTALGGRGLWIGTAAAMRKFSTASKAVA